MSNRFANRWITPAQEIYQSIPTQEELSDIPASTQSFLDAFNAANDMNIDDLTHLSLETLQLMTYGPREYEDELWSDERAVVEEHFYDLLSNWEGDDLLRAVYLMAGIFYEENWRYLSDADLIEWARWHGLHPSLSKDEKVVSILRNEMVVAEDVRSRFGPVTRARPGRAPNVDQLIRHHRGMISRLDGRISIARDELISLRASEAGAAQPNSYE